LRRQKENKGDRGTGRTVGAFALSMEAIVADGRRFVDQSKLQKASKLVGMRVSARFMQVAKVIDCKHHYVQTTADPSHLYRQIRTMSVMRINHWPSIKVKVLRESERIRMKYASKKDAQSLFHV